MSLTDRMAAALRDVMSNGGEADTVAAFAVLAEYEAERNPPKPIAQKGQRVRCISGPHWHGTVLYSKGPTTTVQMDNGEDFLAMTDDLEVIPNLPATNTGD